MRALTLLTLLSFVAAARPALADELDSLAKAVDAAPDDAAAYDAYAKAALKANRFDDVIHKVKIGVARIPTYSQGFYWLAYAYRKKKEWADAADYYRRYITLNPTKTDPYFGLGASLQGLGDTKGAIGAYEKYVALEKAPEKARFVDLAKAELAKLDPSRLPAPIPVAPPLPIATQPPPAAMQPSGDAAALRTNAEQLTKDGKLDDAIAAYQKAIAADPSNVNLYNDLGNVYFALKRYGDAAHWFREAVSRNPQYATGWYNLAHAYRKGELKQDAINAYRQYMQLKPDDPDPYYGLGQTLKAVGDVKGAIEAFKKYVNMEKRPEEQRWVDKARAELQALEAMQAPQPSGRIEEKDAGDQVAARASKKLQRDLGRSERPSSSEDHDDLMNPFDGDDGHWRDLRDPFQPSRSEEFKNPFTPPAPSTANERKTLREYSAAIEAYRRALTRHAEDVSESYERGVAFALADDAPQAQRIFNAVKLIDPRVEAARKGVERVRSLLASRK